MADGAGPAGGKGSELRTACQGKGGTPLSALAGASETLAASFSRVSGTRSLWRCQRPAI
jgi:hypothetical protein